MRISCDECAMQDTVACRDCVVGFLLSDVGGPIEMDADQAEALEILADHGLTAPLRLVPRVVNE